MWSIILAYPAMCNGIAEQLHEDNKERTSRYLQWATILLERDTGIVSRRCTSGPRRHWYCFLKVHNRATAPRTPHPTPPQSPKILGKRTCTDPQIKQFGHLQTNTDPAQCIAAPALAPQKIQTPMFHPTNKLENTQVLDAGHGAGPGPNIDLKLWADQGRTTQKTTRVHAKSYLKPIQICTSSGLNYVGLRPPAAFDILREAFAWPWIA